MLASEGTSQLPRELPLVGRGRDLEHLFTLFGTAPEVEPLVILKGEGGVGKSRLAQTVAAEARRRGWTVPYGRAYPVETGAPYALFSDAFVPVLREMDEARLMKLTRGELPVVKRLFPALGPAGEVWIEGEGPREIQTRLYWSFTELVHQLSERVAPLLIVLEDLHWADASSLALLHFLGRQLKGYPVRILGTYNTEFREESEQLIQLERSFLKLRQLRLLPLHPLSREDTGELIEQVFAVSGPPVRDFADLLFGWTRGNPYFLEQTLDALVSAGRLHRHDGTWLGWEARELELPASVRDAILIRFRGLSKTAVRVAEALAVVGSPAPVALLVDIAVRTPEEEVLEAVEELVRSGLVEEEASGSQVLLQFRHPLTRETLYQELTLASRRSLHRRVAEGLERIHGPGAAGKADELAYHFVRGAERPNDPRAARYLAEAGRAALRRHADREAVDYLDAAVEVLTAASGDEETAPPEPAPTPRDVPALKRELARGRARLGQYGKARELWFDVLAAAEHEDDPVSVGRAHRHLGLIAFWTGQHEGALLRYDAALQSLGDGAPELRARLHVAAGLALQELGRPDAGRQQVERALRLCEELEDVPLLARAHRALSLLAIFTGEADLARRHGWQAVELADRAGDDHVSFWGRWALATLEGLTGGPGAMEELMADCRALADRLRSPVLPLWVTELEVEHAYFSGDWNLALVQGERGIVRAESLNQRTLKVRLQVWTATCYMGRGDLDRARELVEDAWTGAGLAESGVRRRKDVHALVPAYIGRVALLMAEGDYEEAIRVGDEGLAVAARIGYVIWVLHRLLPLVTEARFRAGRVEEAAEGVERLRRVGEPMGHRLALAYAEAGEAMVAWYSGRIEQAVGLLRAAAEGLESIGIVPEAARLRRQLAGRLADLGDREGALKELRAVYHTFDRLGAVPERRKAAGQFDELESRPPATGVAQGGAVLTGRELEVARLVAGRLSNKAVARELVVSPATVATHLRNIYKKLGVSGRVELADMVREGRLSLRPDPE